MIWTRGRDHFVVGGCARARKALKAEVRRQVEAEFAELWNASGCVWRWFLRHRIRAEVARRVKANAPTDALY